jgi:acylphosphatase
MPGLAPSELVRVRVVVSGRVQGVFFRDACREAARAEGLAGWVRNRGDGAVEVELEGPQAAIERVVAWCHDGPPRARVEHVDVTPIPTVGERAFRIR